MTLNRGTFADTASSRFSVRNCGKLYQLESLKVFFRPAGLHLDDALERLSCECIATSMRRHGNPAPIWMPISLVRPDLADEIKPIARESGDQISCTERMEATVVDGHALHSDSNAGFLLRNLSDFNRLGGTLGKRSPFLDEFLDDHMHHIINVLKRFFSRLAPR
jgi:hypothetical protein